MKVRFLVFILFQSTLGYGNYPEDEQCKVTRVVDCSHLEGLTGEGENRLDFFVIKNTLKKIVLLMILTIKFFNLWYLRSKNEPGDPRKAGTPRPQGGAGRQGRPRRRVRLQPRDRSGGEVELNRREMHAGRKVVGGAEGKKWWDGAEIEGVIWFDSYVLFC